MLKALQESADKNSYIYKEVEASLLEKFERPTTTYESDLTIHIEIPEFTSLCPLTGQPDFATIVIEYMPDNWCVESKSLKLYMMSYRNHGAFHESCVTTMLNDLVFLLDPLYIRITGKFTPRGGIPFWPTVEYHK
jgi:7-cyano-7-deazaguanine reductase